MRSSARFGAIAAAALLFAAPSMAFAQEAPADGLYLMTRFWPSTGLEVDGFLFQNGQVVRGPSGDLAAFDFDAARAAAPDRVGTYEVSGDTMKVTWASGSVSESGLEPDGGCFGWDAGLFCPAAPFGSGVLEGVYEGGASGSAALGFAMNSRTIAFAPDGRYEMASAGSVSSETDESTVSGGASGGEAGTYAIDGTVLTLSPDGGASQQVVAFPYGENVDGASPEWIYFGGTMLKRQD